VKRRFLVAGGGTGADADDDASDGLLLPETGAAADAEGGCCERFNRREGFPFGFAPEGPVGPVGPTGGLSDIFYSSEGRDNRQAIPTVIRLSKCHYFSYSLLHGDLSRLEDRCIPTIQKSAHDFSRQKNCSTNGIENLFLFLKQSTDMSRFHVASSSTSTCHVTLQFTSRLAPSYILVWSQFQPELTQRRRQKAISQRRRPFKKRPS
jgi:hypothetical protein